jgi:uncharacterized repeat protein (TIGR03987 family)
MSSELAISTVLITLALVFYTLGVWGERFQRYLYSWHVIAFWLGLFFDGTGTYAMDRLEPGWVFDFHAFTGLTAFLLMAIHAAWATWVVRKGTEPARVGFHRYSMVVWLIWLIPYLGGMFAGMA